MGTQALAAFHGQPGWPGIVSSATLNVHLMSKPFGSLNIPEHIFISFSKDDRAIAERIVDTLRKNDIPVWIDYSTLPPGTPDWEAAIRDAINKAFAVVVLASPQSRASKFVRGELNLAESKGCPIYPFWINGSEWSDCIPLGMTYAQFIDGRGERAEKASAELCRLLEQYIRSVTPRHYLVTPYWRRMEQQRGTSWSGWEQRTITRALPPPGFASVELTKEETGWEEGGSAVFLRTSDYPCMHAFLDELYLNYLTDKYEPFTYGSIWTLVETSCYARLLVPWSWLLNRESSSEMASEWLHHTALNECGLLPSTFWCIRRMEVLEPRGLAVNDERIWHAMQRSPKAEYLLRHRGILLDLPFAKVSSAYRHRIVFWGYDISGTGHLPGWALVQSEKTLPEDLLHYWLHRF